MAEFSVSATVQDGVVVAVVAGDVDLATAERLHEAVAGLIQPGRAVTVDCSGVTFLDSAGLRTLLDLNRRAREAGSDLTLLSPSDVVSRILELAGVTGVLTVRESGARPPAA